MDPGLRSRVEVDPGLRSRVEVEPGFRSRVEVEPGFRSACRTLTVCRVKQQTETSLVVGVCVCVYVCVCGGSWIHRKSASLHTSGLLLGSPVSRTRMSAELRNFHVVLFKCVGKTWVAVQTAGV